MELQPNEISQRFRKINANKLAKEIKEINLLLTNLKKEYGDDIELNGIKNTEDKVCIEIVIDRASIDDLSPLEEI